MQQKYLYNYFIKDGNQFHKIKELLIKGNSIKYFRLV